MNLSTDDEIWDFADKIAYEIQGTSKFLTFVLEEYEAEGMENNSLFCSVLDSKVFCCTACDWWFEISEMSNRSESNWKCEDCGGTEDDE